MNDQRKTKAQPISGNSGRTTASDRNQDWGPFRKRVVVFGATGSIVVALLGLLSYLPGLGLLGSVREGYIPMAPSTTISFIVLAGILLTITLRSLSGAILYLFEALAALVSLFGALEVAGHFTGRDLNFEDLLIPAAGYLGEIPIARMSPSTGALFFIAGLALLALLLRFRMHSRETILGHWGGSLASFVFSGSIVFCLAYLYGSPLLYGQGATIPMALTTALAFVMLGAATVGLSGKDAFPVRLLAAAMRVSKPMNARRRFLFLTLIMVGACAMVMATMTLMLYRHNLKEHRQQLQATVQSQARLVEAIARHDSVYEKNTPGGPTKATLSQIIDAHERYEGHGETGEFMLARREGDYIVFIFRHQYGAVEHPAPVAFDSELAEPMRRALQGLSGTVIGLDYRGEMVLATYEPVAVLNLGMVAKIDLAEIRAPFIRTGLSTAAVALVVVLAGTALFFRIGNPIITRLEAYSRDLEKEVEERKQAERELEESREQLRSLSIHLQSLREESHRFVARELHEELAQSLAALKMDLLELRGKLRVDQKHLQEEIASMSELAGSMLQRMTELSSQLRPAMLDDLGVVPTLKWEAKEFSNRTGIECALTVGPEEIEPDPDRATAVYRIFKEALTNIACHAQATAVKVSLKLDSGQLVMEISDNGIGITDQQIASPQSFGLISIRERVIHWGGETIITGDTGKGTTIAVIIPLDNGADHDDLDSNSGGTLTEEDRPPGS